MGKPTPGITRYYYSMHKKLGTPLAAALLVAAAGAGTSFVTLASAQTTGTPSTSIAQTFRGMMGNHKPGVHGTITAINGNTITIKDERTGTTYIVDAAGATVKTMPDNASVTGAKPQPVASSVAALKVGDTIGVQGTVNGTSVTATQIMSGKMGPGMGHGRGKGPGVHGEVTAVSGNTVTVKGADGKTYSVDVSKATLSKTVTMTVGDIKVGDSVGVMGSINGTQVTAEHLMDGVPPKKMQN